MSEYFMDLRDNLDRGLQNASMMELIQALDRAYFAAIAEPVGTEFFKRLSLICHKSMLSAAALILERLAEDSVGITRRAIEAAKVARAVKLNSANAEQWLAYVKRHDRWLKRRAREKPRSFQVQFLDIKGDTLMLELENCMGTLSDAGVHFTPEFYDSLDWEVRCDGRDEFQIYLNYFHRNSREPERHLIDLVACHGIILKTFDTCFDGALSADPTKSKPLHFFWTLAQAYIQRFRANPQTPHA